MLITLVYTVFLTDVFQRYFHNLEALSPNLPIIFLSDSVLEKIGTAILNSAKKYLKKLEWRVHLTLFLLYLRIVCIQSEFMTEINIFLQANCYY